MKKLYNDAPFVNRKKGQSNEELAAQLAENMNYLSDSVYNAKSLKQSKKQYINAIVFGDSIAAGTGSTSGNYGFLQMFANASLLLQDGFGFSGNMNTFSKMDATWNNDTRKGIVGSLYSSNDTSVPINFPNNNNPAGNNPNYTFKVQLIYSKRPDGGLCDIKNGSTIVTTIDCNGTEQDGLSVILDCNGGSNLTIAPRVGQKAYINGWYFYHPTKTTSKIQIWQQGGTKSSDFTNESFRGALNIIPNDLLIWEYGANDWSQNKIQEYKDKTNYIIPLAKSMGMDVIFVITCGQNGTEGNANWKDYKDFVYATAKAQNCCVIDYDNYFGGYTKAKANGLIADSVHPSTKGHTLMADLLCQVVYGVGVPELQGFVWLFNDFRNLSHGYLQNPYKVNFADVIFEQARVRTGNYWDSQGYGYLQTIHRVSGSYPSLAKVGTIVTETTNNSLEVKKEDNTWVKALANPLLPTITSMPAVSDNNLGKLFRLTVTGQDDQIITYRKKADGTSREWIALATQPVVWS